MVLGANDGLLSIGALLIGVLGADASSTAVVTAGLAGIAAGAGSMAMGEYVSVASQRDAEDADRATEADELASHPEAEHAELRAIYEERGLRRDLADEVATELMSTDALGAHLRDELGLTEEMRARPLLAAVTSFVAFVLGSVAPMTTAVFVSGTTAALVVASATLVGLVLLGGLGATLGGASVARGAARVGVGGAGALALTYLVGRLVGIAV